MELSNRVKAIKPSSTLAVTARAKALKAQGVDVVSFGAGEPDFDTPQNIKIAATKALDAGVTKYQPTAGTPEARKAVANYMNSQHGYSVGPENVIISCGGKHSLYLAFMALVNPGDEVLLPAPYWVSYPEQVKLAGGTVKELQTTPESDFKITPAQLEAAITPKSKVLVINSPSNPTGTMYSPEELKALADVVAKHPNLLVFSDEIYERLVFGGVKFASFGKLRADVGERTVTFNCLSKTYAMTGWRVGFTIGPAALVKAMDDLQGQMTSNITSFCLPAVVEALGGPQDEVETMRKAFAERGEHIHKRLAKIPGVKCPKPTGAFYVFPDIAEAAFGKKDPAGKVIGTAGDFAAALLEHAKVAVVPGEDFGAPKHIRLSFATSMEQIDKGVDRIADFIKNLKK
ncbi:MAG: pyridoxal phosphate-dependent aminotransferase [Phycisphaeraceae bacterium]|nr:pyridoxal phosphate-dependent aminotransferase [Phycisphaeraceae bacterium]